MLPSLLDASLFRSSTSITMGSWPDWLAAVVTSLAFSVAALTYFRSAQDQRRSQARLIYAKVGAYEAFEPGQEFPMLIDGASAGYPEPGAVRHRYGDVAEGEETLVTIAATRVVRVLVELHNGSDEPVLRWLPKLYDYGLKQEYEVLDHASGFVQPHSVQRVVLVAKNPHAAAGQPGLHVNVTFEDSTGRLWRRAQFSPIELLPRRRLKHDPHWRRA